MNVIGHRGCAEQYPENTIHAVRQAARHLDAIEVDVRRCESGELVVFHDETVDRVTDGRGAVSEFAWDELREFEVLGSGHTVPRLADLLAALPPTVAVQLELKQTGMAPAVLDHIEAFQGRVAVSSFLPTALAELRDRGADVPTGYLFEEAPRESVSRALELECQFVHPHLDCCLESDVVETARDSGLGVVAWKAARTRADIEAARSVGLDGITADRWDIAPGASRGASASD